MKKEAVILLSVTIAFSVYSSCHLRKLESELLMEEREFLSKVRYIITKQERKIFLNLHSSERENFVEEFWKKRDPDPYTEENEFKEQYFKRIEEANKLFIEGGPAGWLQDRGRVYILLGPPGQKEIYPTGRSFYGSPMEIWYYGFFPVVFIDKFKDGDYKLEPFSARYISEINKAQMVLKPKVEQEEVVFDCDLKIKKILNNEILIQIEIPYKNIWLIEKENRLETNLEISLEIFDSSEKRVWEYQKNYPISISEESLSELIGKDYILEISAEFEKGDYTIILDLMNTTDESRVRKKAEFTI